jgi:hypothetical protein
MSRAIWLRTGSPIYNRVTHQGTPAELTTLEHRANAFGGGLGESVVERMGDDQKFCPLKLGDYSEGRRAANLLRLAGNYPPGLRGRCADR